MLSKLKVYHREHLSVASKEVDGDSELNLTLSQFERRGFFIINTCQRVLMIGLESYGPVQSFECFNGKEGYEFLLKVICGLKSKVVAESEIVKQFKDALGLYLSLQTRNTKLIQIIEKLFKDSKEIRTNYLKGVGQKTYAAITRKILLENPYSKRVLVVGSGTLSIDVINQLKKRFEQIYVTGRNSEAVQEICQEHMTRALDWKDFDNYMQFPLIVNTIGTDDLVLFHPEFFAGWEERHQAKKLFIDLGYPSVINTELDTNSGVIRLKDIFQKSVIKEREKIEKLEAAKEAIESISEKRHELFTINKLRTQGSTLA